MENSTKSLNDLMKRGFIWFCTAIIAFLTFNTWEMSGLIKELTVEVRHLTEQNTQYDSRFSEMNSNILSLRETQLGLSARLYDYSNLSTITRMNEKEIAVLKEKIFELNKQIIVENSTNAVINAENAKRVEEEK